MIPEGPSSPTARILMLAEQANWFRRMGNASAELASRRAMTRITGRERAIAMVFGESTGLIGREEGGKGGASSADPASR